MSICWRDTKGTASARRGRAPPCTRWIFPELANSRRSRRIVSSETLYRLLRSAARTRPSLPSSSRMYWWRSSLSAIWPASGSGFILLIVHEYAWVCTYIRALSHLCMTVPNVAPYHTRRLERLRHNYKFEILIFEEEPSHRFFHVRIYGTVGCEFAFLCSLIWTAKRCDIHDGAESCLRAKW